MPEQPKPTPPSYMVIHDLEALKPSTYDNWPLHMTVTPPFLLGSVPEEKAVQIIRKTVQSIGPIQLAPDGQSMYGPQFNIPVTLVKDVDGSLRTLHHLLLENLGSAGCSFLDLTYAFDNYSPHISHTSTGKLPSFRYRCMALSVAEWPTESNTDRFRIVERITF